MGTGRCPRRSKPIGHACTVLVSTLFFALLAFAVSRHNQHFVCIESTKGGSRKPVRKETKRLRHRHACLPVHPFDFPSFDFKLNLLAPSSSRLVAALSIYLDQSSVSGRMTTSREHTNQAEKPSSI
eukprot:6484833-Amphidinium_carterae.1